MNELSKIQEVSSRYGVTARTLRYYEDMGLIVSTRNEEYAYRMYDEVAITRLKQILILRKLNISIKDIKHIFEASSSDAVLEALGKKADDIDNEVALLHELKEIEAQLATSNYNGNPSNINHLLDVTEKLDDIRITTPLAIRAYRLKSLGAMRFIGKKYPGEKEAREEWKEKGLYAILEKQLKGVHRDFYEDGDAPMGLMSMRDGFEYWLGYFTSEGTVVPEGFEYEDFPKRDLGVCWIYGKEDEIYMEGIEDVAWKKLEEEGFGWLPDCGDWWMERYSHNRWAADKMGYGISDICFFVKITP
ncbi:MAG: MerR family transcriptional regulator [Firmicutes bacterium]|nr:MerR family transcriptional regulator [Bacillota bacterium]